MPEPIDGAEIPAVLEPLIPPSGGDRTMLLYRGPPEIENEGNRVTGNVSVNLEWRPSVGIRFRFLGTGGDIYGLDAVDAGQLTLGLPELGVSALCQVFEVRHTFPAATEGNVWNGVFDEAIAVGAQNGLSEVRFSVVNFGRAGGRLVRFPSGQKRGGRRIFEASGWRLVMDAIDEQDRPGFAPGGIGDYAVTHTGSLKRHDGGVFDAVDACEVLEALTYFLSFCRGRHCGVGPLVGLNAAGDRVWQRWVIGKVHANVPRELNDSWLLQDEGDAAERVFPELMRKWGDPDWQEVLRLAIDCSATITSAL